MANVGLAESMGDSKRREITMEGKEIKECGERGDGDGK